MNRRALRGRDRVPQPFFQAKLFDPTTVSGLVLRIRSSNVTLDGSNNVQTITDLTGGGADFTQGTAGSRAPIVAAGIGGHQSIDTRAANSPGFFYTSAKSLSAILNGATGATRIMVMAASAAGSQTGQGQISTLFGTSGSFTFMPFTDGHVYDEFFSTTRQDTGVQNVQTPCCYTTTSTAGANNWISRINGSVAFTLGAANVVGASATALNFLGSGVAFWRGLFSEMLIYNRVLTAGELTNIEQKYCSKYYALGF